MMENLVDIDWADVRHAIPAFITIVCMPLTYRYCCSTATEKCSADSEWTTRKYVVCADTRYSWDAALDANSVVFSFSMHLKCIHEDHHLCGMLDCLSCE
jgi:hypothetical protein